MHAVIRKREETLFNFIDIKEEGSMILNPYYHITVWAGLRCLIIEYQQEDVCLSSKPNSCSLKTLITVTKFSFVLYISVDDSLASSATPPFHSCCCSTALVSEGR